MSYCEMPWGIFLFIIYCCPVKLFLKNKLGLTLLTKYQPFWLYLFLLNIDITMSKDSHLLMYYVDFIAFMENPEKTWNALRFFIYP